MTDPGDDPRPETGSPLRLEKASAGGARPSPRQLLHLRGPVLVPGLRPWIAWARAATQWSRWSARASRSEFWWTWLLQVAVAAVFLVAIPLALGQGRDLSLPVGPFGSVLGDLALFTGRGAGDDEKSGVYLVVWMLWCVGTFVPTVTVTVRRLHDANFSAGWAIASVFLPFLQLPVLIMLARPSQPTGVRFESVPDDELGVGRGPAGPAGASGVAVPSAPRAPETRP